MANAAGQRACACRPGLLGLLEVAHLLQRRRVGDVGDGAVAVLGVVADGLLPARRGRTSSCLASRATKIWAFCLPNPGSAMHPREQVGPRCRLGPQPLGVDRRTRRRRSSPPPAPARPSSARNGGSPGAWPPWSRTPPGRQPRSRAGPSCRTGRGSWPVRGKRAPWGTAGRAASRRAARTGRRSAPGRRGRRR